ncbi:MAG: hypothetical protein ACRYG8_35395 [Janthinobacterium lividum]
MQVSEAVNGQPAQAHRLSEPLPPRKPGTIPVTVRLDPHRYDRLKTLVRRLSTTGQSIIQTALDRSMVTLERERLPKVETEGQSSFFTPAIASESPRKPVQDSFPFVRPEPTVSLTYRASVPMHRWLHRRSAETGQTIQEIINDALKVARGTD